MHNKIRMHHHHLHPHPHRRRRRCRHRRRRRSRRRHYNGAAIIGTDDNGSTSLGEITATHLKIGNKWISTRGTLFLNELQWFDDDERVPG